MAEYIIVLLQNGIELPLYLFACALRFFDRRAALLTVARQALRQDPELFNCSICSALFRLARGLVALDLGALFNSRVKLLSEARQGVYRFFKLDLSGIILSAKGESAFFQILKLVCAREYARSARGAASCH